MQKIVISTVSLSLLILGASICATGCGRNKESVPAPNQVVVVSAGATATPTEVDCPICGGTGRRDTCERCDGKGCATCLNTGMMLCGGCNGNRTVRESAVKSIEERMERLRLEKEEKERERLAAMVAVAEAKAAADKERAAAAARIAEAKAAADKERIAAAERERARVDAERRRAEEQRVAERERQAQLAAERATAAGQELLEQASNIVVNEHYKVNVEKLLGKSTSVKRIDARQEVHYYTRGNVTVSVTYRSGQVEKVDIDLLD